MEAEPEGRDPGVGKHVGREGPSASARRGDGRSEVGGGVRAGTGRRRPEAGRGGRPGCLLSLLPILLACWVLEAGVQGQSSYILLG